MKILFVVTYIESLNGINSFIKSQAESLQEEGITIEYFYLRGWSLSKYFKGIFELKAHLKNNSYDLIHAHYSYNGYTSSFQNSTPFITSFMGTDILENSGTVKKKIKNAINEKLKKCSSHLIVKSEEMKESLQTDVNISVIPNGVDLTKFYPIDKQQAREELNLDPNKKYILFAANPEVGVKNYSLAKEAYNKLKIDNKELLSIYKKPQEELNLYFNAADVLIFTSHYEGSPNVIKEAMATNGPIVAVNVGDIKERFENITNSFLCDHNSTQLSERINTIIINEERSNGREVLEAQGLDRKGVAKKIIEVYNNCIR